VQRSRDESLFHRHWWQLLVGVRGQWRSRRTATANWSMSHSPRLPAGRHWCTFTVHIELYYHNESRRFQRLSALGCAEFCTDKTFQNLKCFTKRFVQAVDLLNVTSDLSAFCRGTLPTVRTTSPVTSRQQLRGTQDRISLWVCKMKFITGLLDSQSWPRMYGLVPRCQLILYSVYCPLIRLKAICYMNIFLFVLA